MPRFAMLALTIFSCARAPPAAPKAPAELAVRFERFAIEEPGLYRAVLLTVWKVENPTPQPVTLSRWSLKVQVAETPVPGTPNDPEVTVPAQGSADVELRMPVDYTAMFGDHLPYQNGWVASIAPLAGTRELSDRASGAYRLPRTPTISFGRLHVERGGTTFDVDLGVVLVNPNDFPVSVGRFDGEVLFAGDRFGRLQSGEAKLLPLERLELPFKLSSSKMRLNGLARAALQSTEAVSADVKGEAVLDGRKVALSHGGMIWPR